MKRFIVLISLLLVSGLAFASSSENGCENSGGRGAGCDDGYNNDPASNFFGGDGGDGFGVGVGVGVGIAGALAESNVNSANSNLNTNTVDVSNSLVANGGNATVGPITNNNTATGGAGGSASATGGNIESGAVNVQVNGGGNGGNRPVSTALAPALTSGIDTCMGSVSAGGQGVGFGLSVGTTYIDQNCVLIKSVKMLMVMGMPEVACFRARMGEEGKLNDEAMKLAGVDCAMWGTIAPEVDIVVGEHEELRSQDAELESMQKQQTVLVEEYTSKLEEQRTEIQDVEQRLAKAEAKYNKIIQEGEARRKADREYAQAALVELQN